jgi:hypothetical protein
VRFLLPTVCVAAIASAAFLLWSSTRTSDTAAAAMRQFEASAVRTRVNLSDLRAAQQSYVAAGQGEDFWFGRVTSIAKDIEDAIGSLRAAVTTPGAATDLEVASTALQEFLQMDLRARDFVRTRQTTLASDMVFADGLELTKKAADAVERALTAEQVSRDADAARIRRQQAAGLGGAAGITLLSVIALAALGRKSRPEPIPAAVAPVTPQTAGRTLGELRETTPNVRPAPAPRPAVDLEQVAAICAELARVPDTQALPALLAKTAAILDATGIILWIADPDARELAPILVHGYPPQLAGRLGTIPRDAENVTASAYRTGLLQRMKADAISGGAIAVPLVSPGGCVGVMAAEMNNGGEQKDALLAAATIVAAQLATLVGPPAARAKNEAAG